MSYKILKVIFVILLLVTIGEAGYYIIVLKNPMNTNDLSAVKLPDNLIPTPSVVIISDVLDSLRLNRYKPGRTFYLIQEITGIVGEAKEAQDQYGPFISITINDRNNNKISSIFYKPAEIGKVRFVKMSGDKETDITYKDLKAGDKISFYDKTNLSDDKAPAEIIYKVL